MRNLTILLALVLSLSTQPAHATMIPTGSESTENASAVTFQDSSQRHTFEAGAMLQYVNYQEEFNPLRATRNGATREAAKDSGLLPGIILGYSYQNPSSPWLFRTSFSYQSNKIKTLREAQVGQPNPDVESDLSILEFRVVAGFTLLRTSFGDLALYSGATARKWERQEDVSNFQTGGVLRAREPLGEIYASLYLPVGLRWTLFQGHRFQAAVDAAVGIPIVTGYQMAIPQYGTFTSPMETGLSWNVQTPVSWWMSQRLGVVITPFFEASSYDYTYVGNFRVNIAGVNLAAQNLNKNASSTYQVGTQLKLALKF